MDILELIDDKDQTIAEISQRPFQCPEPECGKSFNRKSDLQRHHRIHTNERPYTCHFRDAGKSSDCGKSFIQRSALTVHIRTHTGEKPHKCQYIGCAKCFSDSSSLARHRRIHTGKRPYRCPIDGCEKSFCRKTTLTKHARRQHQLLEHDGAESGVDETDEDAPANMRNKSMVMKAQQKKAVARRLQQQRKDAMTLSTTMFCPNSGFHEPLTPHNLITLQSAPSSRHTSFSAASSGCYNDSQMSMHMSNMHQPPTPQSPYYEEDPEHHRSISPGYHTPSVSQSGSVNGSFDSGLRIVCETPTPHQLLAAAQQTLHSSPGSLSSCSTASNGSHSSVDYFCRAPQQSSTPYQSPFPISPGTVPHYSMQQQHHNAPQYHQTVQFQPASYSAPTMPHVPQMHPQHVWYELNQHQHHLMSQHSSRMEYGYMGPQDMPCIKQEPENSMLPTPRGSFC